MCICIYRIIIQVYYDNKSPRLFSDKFLICICICIYRIIIEVYNDNNNNNNNNNNIE